MRVGVDEAGRGAVLGPLVCAGVASLGPPHKIDSVQKLLHYDSKRLSKKQRELAESRLRAETNVLTAVQPVPAYEISSRMSSSESLDSIAANAAVQVTAQLMSQIPDESAVQLVCDAIGSARMQEALHASLMTHLPEESDAIITNGADHSYAECAAASVIAKTARDDAMRQLQHQLGMEIGSGYPASAQTRKFVQRVASNTCVHATDHGISHSDALALQCIRCSWRTAQRVGILPSTYFEIINSYSHATE